MSTAAPGSPILIYVILGLIFSFGLFLLIFGLLGKRIDDHPWCRKCKFDLFGRAQDAERTCPECGCDLSKAKAIRIGQRRKRRGMLIIGALFFVIGLAGLGVKGYTDATHVDWQQHKPVWWLMREASQSPGPTSDAALIELLHRQDTGELDASQVGDLIELALMHQADISRPWQIQWGILVEEARTAGIATDDQWHRYVANLLIDPLEFELRPKSVIASERYAIGLHTKPARIGDRIQPELLLKLENEQLQIGTVTKELRGWFNGRHFRPASDDHTVYYPILSSQQWNAIKPGQHTVRYSADLVLYENGQYYRARKRLPALATGQIELETRVEFLDRHESSVTTVNDPAVRQQVENAINIYLLESGLNSSGLHALRLCFHVGERPVDIAFKAYLRHNGTEYELPPVALDSGRSGNKCIETELGVDLRNQKVDVIFRPSPKAAEKTIDCFEIWGEEIIFKDVIVEQDE